MSNMRKTISVFTLSALMIAAPSIAGVASSADIVPDGSAEGMSTAYRSNHGVGMTAVLTGLAPDTAHTVWAAIFNRPHKCAVPNACGSTDTANPAVKFQLTQASRNYSDENGNTSFSGFIPKGAALQRPNRAEIHFIFIQHTEIASTYNKLNNPGPDRVGFSIHQH